MKAFLLLIFLIPLFNLNAQYQLDTLSSYYVGPGVIYTKIQEPTKPWLIYIMEVDLKNPYIKMETAKAKDLKLGVEIPSSMAKRQDSSGHRVVGIVNADFFLSNGEPDNMQVVRGELIRDWRGGQYGVVGFDTSNNYMLALPYFHSKVIKDTSEITINDVNEVRGSNQLIMYNSYYGSSTGTQSSGTEAVLSPIGEWYVNDTIYCIVKSIAQTSGNTPINKKQLVLSANGTSADLLKNSVKAGDTIGVYIEVSSGPKKIRELVGGRPIFFKDSELIQSITNISVVMNREPRTMIGFSKDSSKCFIFVVDGRQTTSVGVDIFEMGNLMDQLNIYNAMNFDGGGSADMVIRGNVVNSPSGGAERPVSNGLMVISTAPNDALNSLVILPKTTKIFRGKGYKFSVIGNDQFYNQVALNSSNIQFSCDSKIGSITSDGLFTSAKHADTGYVYVRYNNLVDSASVIIKEIEHFSISPKTATADATTKLPFKVSAFDSENILQTVSLTEFNWISRNPSVGIVDSAGNFWGKSEGSTYVVSTYNNYSDSALIKVAIGTGAFVLDSIESLAGWSYLQENLDSLSITLATDEKSLGNASFKIGYKFTYNAQNQNMVYLYKNIPIYGVPDSIFLDVKSDGQKHRLYYQFSDNNSELYQGSGKKYLDNSQLFDKIPAPFTGMKALQSGSSFNFPVILKRIELQLSGSKVAGQSSSGTIYIDNLWIKYPDAISSIDEELALPNDFSLDQNYPNPFNPNTKIGFSLPKDGIATLKIYDILGRELAELINKELPAGHHIFTFNAHGVPSGIYFYKLQSSGYAQVKKMLLLK
ncbi:MAG: phosphodiester glycosidase family protein [Ignavibacteriales bacterium]|nr:phosphodiester glycosidase family protein [Ignavibacteriales bacterium]